MFAAFFGVKRWRALLIACLLIAVIALLDWQIVGQVPLGFLYLLPMLALGNVLSTWQIAVVAALCTALAEIFDDYAWVGSTGISRDVLYFAAFLGAGLFVREVSRNRRTTLRHMQEIEQQSSGRQAAEEQLELLIESSPAAILTADADGAILRANEAARRLLAPKARQLRAQEIQAYLPTLATLSGARSRQQFFRTVMQARARRDDGDTFMADICLSTYETRAGWRITAVVLDASEDLRNHEVAGFHQLLEGSRIAIGAVTHEVRNISGALAAVHRNLALTNPASPDFEALGNLIEALERIAGLNVRQSSIRATEVDCAAVLEELRIIVGPSLEEADIQADWQIAPDLPQVWADRPSLMQVFLNLITNSVRAMGRRGGGHLTVRASCADAQVAVEIADNGGGIPHPEHLFHPFQDGAESSGLGLYLSRAFLRTFGGEIRYIPIAEGACFLIRLTPVSTLDPVGVLDADEPAQHAHRDRG